MASSRARLCVPADLLRVRGAGARCVRARAGADELAPRRRDLVRGARRGGRNRRRRECPRWHAVHDDDPDPTDRAL